MIGKPSGYDLYANRGKSYTGDLMALNAINQGDAQRGESPSRFMRDPLKIDDIQGATAKSSYLKRGAQVPNNNLGPQGLNLPSYENPNRVIQNPPSPLLNRRFQNKPRGAMVPFATVEESPSDPGRLQTIQEDKRDLMNTYEANYNRGPAQPVNFSKNDLANFFGTTPEVTRQNFANGPQIPSKVAANFYGVTPVPSRGNMQDMDYNYRKNAAQFYGVTPPQTGDPNNFPSQSYNRIQQRSDPRQNQPTSTYQDPTYMKNAAQFYGVTPPQTGDANIYPSQSYNRIQQRNDPRQNQPVNTYQDPTYMKNAAQFYGVTPPASSGGQNFSNQMSADYSKNAALFYGATPQQTRSNQLYPNQQITDSNLAKNAAKFYGVTPPPTGGPGGPRGYTNEINVSSKDLANFYGVTPTQTGYPTDNYSPGQDQTYMKNAAKFYGVTPPPTGSQPYPNRGSNFLARPANQQQQGSYRSSSVPPRMKNEGYTDAEFQLAASKFYGVDPDPRVAGEMEFKKNAEKFYGVSEDNGGEYQGYRPIDPEFQQAADVARRPPVQYQQNVSPNFKSPMNNNRSGLISNARRILG